MTKKFMTYREIADALGIDESTVRETERRALAKLSKSGKLQQFYEMVLDKHEFRSDIIEVLDKELADS